jgi:hypothetical protein
MYCISEEQIDFILSDISARGIEMESLQQNLVDHICCLIEHNLEEDGDFESFYFSSIATFYKVELKEIEEETINLIINKNYYIMKKIMIISGSLSAGILSLGILFKFMHWPGAAALILLGIIILSFVFLPLLFTLKVKEKQQNSDKAIVGIGTLSAILISIGILFKVMHWPFASILSVSALAIMMFLFIPIYFFTGIRNPSTKVNTIVSSILLVVGCGLILVLVRAPAGTKSQYISDTGYFVRNEQIVKTEQRQVQELIKKNTESQAVLEQSQQINRLCNELKAFVLQQETGFKTIDSDFENKEIFIGDTWVGGYFSDSSEAMNKLNGLKKLIQEYNQAHSKSSNLQPIPLKATVFEAKDRVKEILNDFIQIQMVVLQNQRELLAMK